MVGVFKQKNPGNTLLLVVYALVLKFPSILNSPGAVRDETDHYLYNLLLRFLTPLEIPGFVYGILAFFCLLIQAMLFNRICNVHKMTPKPNYLFGMAYLLLTSLFREWNYFSAPLLINTLLILLFYRMLNLYNSSKPLGSIFNIGLLLGIVTLLYQPAVLFILLVPFVLLIMRPFRIREWLVGFLGITTPYYFLALEPLITNNWNLRHLLPRVTIDLPEIPSSIFVTIGISLLVIPFIIGGYFVQNNLNKVLIQIRKSWSLLLIFLIISLLLILADGGEGYTNWIFSIISLSAFHAAAYYFPVKKLFTVVMHWVVFGFAIYMQYFH